MGFYRIVHWIDSLVPNVRTRTNPRVPLKRKNPYKRRTQGIILMKFYPGEFNRKESASVLLTASGL